MSDTKLAGLLKWLCFEITFLFLFSFKNHYMMTYIEKKDNVGYWEEGDLTTAFSSCECLLKSFQILILKSFQDFLKWF